MIKEQPSLTIVRRIKASPEKIYAAWTKPELMARWWGPDAGPVLSAEADPRVGGAFRVVFQTLDGETHDCGGAHLGVGHHARAPVARDDQAAPYCGRNRAQFHPCPILRRGCARQPLRRLERC